MFAKDPKCLVFLLTVIVHSSKAFWWSSPPTTTEAPTVLKQIPLTYFRTLTYTPLTGNPFAFPFFGAAQTPVLTGARYDQYAPNVYPNILPVSNNLQLLKAPSLVTTTSSTTPPTTKPTTTSTTTTTTTTTTPLPTTTTTSTTASTSATTANRHGVEPLINPNYSSYPEYPTYNRRMFPNSYGPAPNYRPSYPYPEYYTSAYNNPNLKVGNSFNLASKPSQLQFVPCLCPINMPSGNGAGSSATLSSSSPISYAEQSNPPSYFTQSRSTADDERGMELPTETTLTTNSANVVIEPEVQTLLNKPQTAPLDTKEPPNPLTSQVDGESSSSSTKNSSTHSKEN